MQGGVKDLLCNPRYKHYCSSDSPNLNGLLTCWEPASGLLSPPTPRASWWAMRRHGDMSGRYLLPRRYEPSSPLVGIASIDCAAGQAMALLGYLPPGYVGGDASAPRPTPRSITAALTGADCLGQRVRVLYEYLPARDDGGPLAQPIIVANRLLQVGANGTVLLEAADVAPLGAMAVTISAA